MLTFINEAKKKNVAYQVAFARLVMLLYMLICIFYFIKNHRLL